MFRQKGDFRMINFGELYELSCKITKKLDELFTLTINGIIVPDTMEYEALIEKVKLLVIKESSLVSCLEREDVEICLIDLKTILRENFEVESDDDLNDLGGLETYIKSLGYDYEGDNIKYDIYVLIRVFDRLKNRIYILDGEVVRLKFRLVGNEFVNYDVSIWDAIISELNIDFLKIMKDKIYKLVPVQAGDSEFISELKTKFESLSMNVLFSNFASEMKALYAKNNIDRMKVTDIERFKKLMSFDLEIYASLLLENAKYHAEDLANIIHLDYSSRDVFELLRNVTVFETMIKYMDLDTLRSINDYCQSISNNQNNPCMSGINNFVKARIKREERK